MKKIKKNTKRECSKRIPSFITTRNLGVTDYFPSSLAHTVTKAKAGIKPRP